MEIDLITPALEIIQDKSFFIKSSNTLIAVRWILQAAYVVFAFMINDIAKGIPEFGYLEYTFWPALFLNIIAIVSDVFYTYVLNAKDGDTEEVAGKKWVRLSATFILGFSGLVSLISLIEYLM